VWLGLVRLGYSEQADELARRIAQTISSHGLHEYYDPYTGRGMGAPEFAWSALALEIVDPDPEAASSYLR
jgi:glycogen debranching enzyme